LVTHGGFLQGFPPLGRLLLCVVGPAGLLREAVGVAAIDLHEERRPARAELMIAQEKSFRLLLRRCCLREHQQSDGNDAYRKESGHSDLFRCPDTAPHWSAR
jgi:hypothetical protein